MDYVSDDGLFSALEEPLGLRRLENLQVYQVAIQLGKSVWDQVSQMDFFSRDTVGKQWVRAADSVAANIAEGYGRFSYKENLRFCYYARGSLFETRTWLQKAAARNLISREKQESLQQQLSQAQGLLNGYILYIKKHITQ